MELVEEEDADLNLLLPVDSKERRVVLREAGVQVGLSKFLIGHICKLIAKKEKLFSKTKRLKFS